MSIDGVLMEKTSNPFMTITVCRKNLRELIDEGKYDLVNFRINAENFPVADNRQYTAQIELVSLDARLKPQNILQELREQGLRPADIFELLCLGAQHQYVQQKWKIMTIDTTYQEHDDHTILCLWTNPQNRRSLSLLYFGGRWSSNSLFAAVRESNDLR